jgi:hypothetical protein
LPAEVQSRHDKNLQRMTPQQVCLLSEMHVDLNLNAFCPCSFCSLLQIQALLSVDIPLLQMYRNWLRDDISRLE